MPELTDQQLDDFLERYNSGTYISIHDLPVVVRDLQSARAEIERLKAENAYLRKQIPDSPNSPETISMQQQAEYRNRNP